jgi:hypothetical protein
MTADLVMDMHYVAYFSPLWHSLMLKSVNDIYSKLDKKSDMEIRILYRL